MGVPTGTLIAVPHGAVPVERLRPGDRVLALTDSWLVTRVELRDDDEGLVEIVTEHGSLLVSEDQFVMVRGLWFRADRLVHGDLVARMLPRWPERRRRRRRRGPDLRTGTPNGCEQVTNVRRWEGRSSAWEVKVAGEHCFWADGFLVRG